jgi:hypothetical protein
MPEHHRSLVGRKRENGLLSRQLRDVVDEIGRQDREFADGSIYASVKAIGAYLDVRGSSGRKEMRPRCCRSARNALFSASAMLRIESAAPHLEAAAESLTSG